MKSSLLSLLLGALFVGVVSCSGSSGGGGGGGAAAPQPHPMAKASPVCTAALKLPEAFGNSCSAGSNLQLCGMNDRLCGGVCLFDGRSGKPQAYCTASCDPKAAKGCPSGFACVQEGCRSRYYCAKTGEPVDRFKGLVVGTEKLPSGTGSGLSLVLAKAINSQGDRLFVTTTGDLLLRKADGTWSSVSEGNPGLQRLSPARISVIGGAFFLHLSSNGTMTRQLYRVEAGKVAAVPTPNDIDGNVCTGEVARGCSGEILRVWRDSAGRLSLILQRERIFREFKMTDKGWQRQVIASDDLAKAAQAVALEDGTFLSIERPETDDEPDLLWLSRDLETWTEVKLPEHFKGDRLNVVGYAQDDLWLMEQDGSTYHWIGNNWVEEDSLPNNVKTVLKSGSSYLAVGGDKMAVFQSGCWRTFPRVEGLIPLGRYFGLPAGDEVALIDPLFQPEY